MEDFIRTCHYCKEPASKSIPLVSMYAPGTYYQHWNFEHQFGCFGNAENTNPRGEKVTSKLPVNKYYISNK